MKAAIYARKSKDTQKGESTANQISRCQSLCDSKGWEYEVYEDYGISGKNTDRPELQRMMQDIKKGKIHTVVCYKLDRISRSVNDFSTLIQELTDDNVGFISLNESFDTSTPMGRAMMMITSVFAQLERETIAERVRDNMLDRAKLGKWNGGPAPLGYLSEKVQYAVGAKTIKGSRLVVDEENAYLVGEIYSTFMKLRSIRGTARAFNERCSCDKFNQVNVRVLLSNPIYCVADEKAYDFFASCGMQIASDRSEFDGTHAVMCYNRRRQHKNTTALRPTEEWIIAVGEHQPLVDSQLFIDTHNLLQELKTKHPRTGTGLSSPLSGIPIRCAECGNVMCLGGNKAKKTDKEYKYVYYKCTGQNKLPKGSCTTKSIRADSLERQLFQTITELFNQDDTIAMALEAYKKELGTQVNDSEERIATLRRSITQLNKEIGNLVDALSAGILPENIIKNKYQALAAEKERYENELNEVLLFQSNVNAADLNVDIIKDVIGKLQKTGAPDILNMSFEDRKALYHSVIEKIDVFPDRSVKVHFFFEFCEGAHLHSLSKHNKIVVTKTLKILEDVNELPENTVAQKLLKYLKANDIQIKTFAHQINLDPSTITKFCKGQVQNLRPSNVQKILDVYPDLQSIFTSTDKTE